MLQALNIFFFIFQTVLVLFNILGWMWRRTRRWNLITLGAIAFSWFVMGFWRGIGYCLCTDWHMQVRRQLGYHDTAQTYIQLMSQTLTGLTPPTQLTETVTAIVFAISVVASVGFNISDMRRTKSRALGPQKS
jgi:hypothetical protein